MHFSVKAPSPIETGTTSELSASIPQLWPFYCNLDHLGILEGTTSGALSTFPPYHPMPNYQIIGVEKTK